MIDLTKYKNFQYFDGTLKILCRQFIEGGVLKVTHYNFTDIDLSTDKCYNEMETLFNDGFFESKSKDMDGWTSYYPSEEVIDYIKALALL